MSAQDAVRDKSETAPGAVGAPEIVGGGAFALPLTELAEVVDEEGRAPCVGCACVEEERASCEEYAGCPFLLSSG